MRMISATLAHHCIHTAFADGTAGCDHDIIHDGPVWQLGALKSFEASRCWGHRAEWCTAVSEASFDSYMRRGILVVIRHKPSRLRRQLHVPTGEFRTSGGQDDDWPRFRRRHRWLVAAIAGYWLALPRSRRRSARACRLLGLT